MAAWSAVRSPGMKIELTKRAIAMARKAVELEPNSSFYANTLGVAHYRAGDWPAAIEALEKSEALNNGQSLAFNGFFLAMAHYQLGQEDEARQWYETSVEWTQKNQPDDEELIRFRTEAEGILGIPVETATPEQIQPQRGDSQ
jgi:tetratricopeptide (TPR) repeat protein